MKVGYLKAGDIITPRHPRKKEFTFFWRERKKFNSDNRIKFNTKLKIKKIYSRFFLRNYEKNFLVEVLPSKRKIKISLDFIKYFECIKKQ